MSLSRSLQSEHRGELRLLKAIDVCEREGGCEHEGEYMGATGERSWIMIMRLSWIMIMRLLSRLCGKRRSREQLILARVKCRRSC